jgi:hypothetical protein
MKVGSCTIPPEASVIDGYWRWDDPLPALVHYPFMMASIITDISKRYWSLVRAYSSKIVGMNSADRRLWPFDT